MGPCAGVFSAKGHACIELIVLTRIYTSSGPHGSQEAARASVIRWITDNRAVGTKKTYTGYARRYMDFVVKRGLDPVVQSSLCAFMKHGLEDGLGEEYTCKRNPRGGGGHF